MTQGDADGDGDDDGDDSVNSDADDQHPVPVLHPHHDPSSMDDDDS